MNAYTTIEESKQLIEAGLDINTADMLHEQHNNAEPYVTIKPWTTKGKSIGAHILPCWSLAALLNIIDNNNIVYDICNDKNRDFKILVYDAEYIKQTLKFYHTENNIIDMIIWLLKNNYIKNDKNS